MSVTIKAQFFTAGRNNFDETIDYLNRIGVSAGRLNRSLALLIELRDKPAIV